MVPSIANVLSGFKRNWTEVISSKELESFFRAEGVKWRDRVLTPGRTRSKWIKAIGKEDQIIQWFKPESKPKSITRFTACAGRLKPTSII